MSKEPASRYATAQELADDLRRFLEDKPILARRPSLAEQLHKWMRRNAVLALSVLAGMSLADGGSVDWDVPGASRIPA